MTQELTKVRLYGNLAKICKIRELELQVSSMAEVIRALICNFPEVKKELEKEEAKYTILVGSEATAEQELFFPFSNKQVVRIVPVVAGAGGAFKIIVGVALIAASGGFGSFGVAGFFAEGSILGGIVGKLGMSLLLGGISSLFMKQPDQPSPAEPAENDPSFYFRGAVNTTAQGHPVPIGYGELIVGSNVIGAGLTTVDI